MRTLFSSACVLFLSLFLFAVFSSPVHAAFSPVAIGIVPPVAFPPSDFSITGARVSLIYGDQRDIFGLDLGVIGNITRQSFVGIGVSGLFNITHGPTTVLGLQLAGLMNYTTEKTHVFGVQVAGLVNQNTAVSSVTGLQLALAANLSEHTDIYGFQIGLYNKAQSVYGFQIGLVNVANSLHGLQIGLINFHQTGLFAVSPILNVGF
jgi:hypothetical protein